MKKILGNKYTITILIVLIISVVLYYIVKNKKSNYSMDYMNLSGLKNKVVSAAAIVDQQFCDKPEITTDGCGLQCDSSTCGGKPCPVNVKYWSCMAWKNKCTQKGWLEDLIWYLDNSLTASKNNAPKNGWQCFYDSYK